MRSLARQTAAFAVTLVAALALLGAAAAFSQTALARAAAVAAAPAAPAARVAGLAGSFLLPSVLTALLAAALYAGSRGGSLVMAALALAAFAGGRQVLAPRPQQPPAAAAPRLNALVLPREIRPLADPAAWLYAGEVRADRLSDVLVISAPASAAPAAPRLAYVAEVRPGPGLTIGRWRLDPQPAALTLLAADESIRSMAQDLSALEGRMETRPAQAEAVLALAGALLVFAGIGVLVRRSSRPVLAWSLGLVIARGALFALGPRGHDLAAKTLGAAAALAPAAAVLAAGAVLVAADLLALDKTARRRGALLG